MARGRPFLKGHKALPGAGRPKGSPNKRNVILEEAFARVITPEIAEQLVGLALREWSKGKGGLASVLFPYCVQELPKAIIHSGLENAPASFTFKFDTFNKNGHKNGKPENGKIVPAP